MLVTPCGIVTDCSFVQLLNAASQIIVTGYVSITDGTASSVAEPVYPMMIALSSFTVY